MKKNGCLNGKRFFDKNLGDSQRYTGFTLAEVLVTLGIIGIIASMTIPSLLQSSQEAEYKTGKDKVRMSIAEAGKMMSVMGTIADATSAEDFVKNHLAKQLKIAKFCAPEDMEQCGMPSGNPTKFKNLYNANVASMPKTWTSITAAYGVTGPAPSNGLYAPTSTSNPTTQNFNNSYAFLSADGVAVNLFYNPYCAYDAKDKMYHLFYINPDVRYQYSLDTACMAGVYDMNGLKKPNQVGKDIGFFGVFYNGIQSTAAATLPSKEGVNTSSNTWTAANAFCEGLTGMKLPTIDELSTLYLGIKITGLSTNVLMWSGSILPGDSTYARRVNSKKGNLGWYKRSLKSPFRCVRD